MGRANLPPTVTRRLFYSNSRRALATAQRLYIETNDTSGRNVITLTAQIRGDHQGRLMTHQKKTGGLTNRSVRLSVDQWSDWIKRRNAGAYPAHLLTT